MKKTLLILGLSTLLFSTTQAGYFDTLQPNDTATETAIEGFTGTEFISGESRNTVAGMNNILKSLKYLKNNTGGKFIDGTTPADAVFTGGNVGIGTNNPSTKLEVYDGSNTTSVGLRVHTANNGIPAISLDNESTSFSIMNNANKFLITNTTSSYPGGAEFTISTNGNIGIGTASPTVKLEVTGEIKISTESSTCDVDHIGTMKYEPLATIIGGDFLGCVQTVGADTSGDATDDVFVWKSITGVVQ